MKQMKFNTAGAHGLLKGYKTQTRRPIKEDTTLLEAAIRMQNSGTKALAYALAYEDLVDKAKYKVGEIVEAVECAHAYVGPEYGESERPFAKIRVVNIRVERLRDISEEDAVAEGVPRHMLRISRQSHSAAKRFADTIWKPLPYPPEYQWDANPWVWVIEVEVVQGEREYIGYTAGPSS